MTFRKYISAIAMAGALLSSTACDDLLEFEPQGELLEEEALTSGQDLQYLLNSCYDVLGSDKFLGGRAQVIGELMADNLDGSTLNGDFQTMYTHRSSFFDDYKNKFYEEPYYAIFRANTILDNIDLAEGENKARLEGEALLVRAIAHFELNRYYEQNGEGIPFKDSSIPAAAQRAESNTLHTQLTQDVIRAIDLLPLTADEGVIVTTDGEGNQITLPVTGNVFGTKWAAKALLARMFFYENDYENAFLYANDVIENGPFSLDTDLSKRFSMNGSNEMILGFSSTSSDVNRTSELTNNFRTNQDTPPTLIASQSVYQTYAPNDNRRAAWFNADAFAPLIGISKFNGDFNQMNYLHLTEMHLIRAEAAAASTENLAAGAASMQLLLDRAYGTGNRTAPTEASSLLEMVRNERRLEMIGEGDRYYQIKQLGKAGEIITFRGATWNCPGMSLQFPQNEIANNPGFERNVEGGCQ